MQLAERRVPKAKIAREQILGSGVACHDCHQIHDLLTLSHLVSVPPGPHLLSDVIQQSPILFDADRAPAAGGSGAGEDGMMGMDDFDASNDPELAMAIRLSMQEAQERAERERAPDTTTATDVAAIPEEPPVPKDPEQGRGGLDAATTAPLSNANDPTIPEAPGDEGAEDDEDYMDDDEEAMLARAMALSRGDDPDAEDIAMDYDEDEEDEDAAIARAIAMSLEENKEDKDKKSS